MIQGTGDRAYDGVTQKDCQQHRQNAGAQHAVARDGIGHLGLGVEGFRYLLEATRERIGALVEDILGRIDLLQQQDVGFTVFAVQQGGQCRLEAFLDQRLLGLAQSGEDFGFLGVIGFPLVEFRPSVRAIPEPASDLIGVQTGRVIMHRQERAVGGVLERKQNLRADPP
jgi:hypothetical protein